MTDVFADVGHRATEIDLNKPSHCNKTAFAQSASDAHS